MGIERMAIMGIDPGATGAISFLTENSNDYWSHNLKDMTDLEIHKLMSDNKDKVSLCVLEKICGAMPKMSKSSIMKLMGSYRSLRMAAICNGLRIIEVLPNKWMTALKCNTRGDKRVTRDKAQTLFPNIKITLDNADSLLIAEYGRLYEANCIKG